jgi:hypothetical protein
MEQDALIAHEGVTDGRSVHATPSKTQERVDEMLTVYYEAALTPRHHLASFLLIQHIQSTSRIVLGYL